MGQEGRISGREAAEMAGHGKTGASSQFKNKLGVSIGRLGASYGGSSGDQNQEEISYALSASMASSSKFDYSISQFSSVDPNQQTHKFMGQQRRATVLSGSNNLAEEPIEELIDESRDGGTSPSPALDARKDDKAIMGKRGTQDAKKKANLAPGAKPQNLELSASLMRQSFDVDDSIGLNDRLEESQPLI